MAIKTCLLDEPTLFNFLKLAFLASDLAPALCSDLCLHFESAQALKIKVEENVLQVKALHIFLFLHRHADIGACF